MKGHWCHACLSEAREGLTQMDGSIVRKADLTKRKNDEEVRTISRVYVRCFLACSGAHLAALQESGSALAEPGACTWPAPQVDMRCLYLKTVPHECLLPPSV